ncbi:hypothetical protein ACFQ51_35060 [Streptomyces kaempferi]
MPAVQPALDGTVPAPTLDYPDWVDRIRPAFAAAARTGHRFTTYEIAKNADLPEPTNPRADWGNAVQSFVRDGLIEHVDFERSSGRRVRSPRCPYGAARGRRRPDGSRNDNGPAAGGASETDRRTGGAEQPHLR